MSWQNSWTGHSPCSRGTDGRYYTYEGLALILVVSFFTLLSRLTGTFPHTTLMTNHVLTAPACLLMFRIGRALKYSVRTSILLALIYGVGTMALVHSRYLMPEPLTTVVFLAAFLFLLRYKETSRKRYLFLCGCSTGLSIVVRPDAALFILTMGLGVGFLLYNSLRKKEAAWPMVFRDALIFILPIIFFFLAIEKGIIHPTLNYEFPDPECDLDYVPNEAREKDVRIALSISAGFGGVNSVVLLRKFEERPLPF